MADEHRVAQEEERGWRRWACTCGWFTEWTSYTSATDAAEAIRHELEHRNAGKDIAL